MKRGDWIRLKWCRIAHFVVCVGSQYGNDVYIACCGYAKPRAVYTVDVNAPRCKKCLKAMEIARRGRN